MLARVQGWPSPPPPALTRAGHREAGRGLVRVHPRARWRAPASRSAPCLRRSREVTHPCSAEVVQVEIRIRTHAAGVVAKEGSPYWRRGPERSLQAGRVFGSRRRGHLARLPYVNRVGGLCETAPSAQRRPKRGSRAATRALCRQKRRPTLLLDARSVEKSENTAELRLPETSLARANPTTASTLGLRTSSGCKV